MSSAGSIVDPATQFAAIQKILTAAAVDHPLVSLHLVTCQADDSSADGQAQPRPA